MQISKLIDLTMDSTSQHIYYCIRSSAPPFSFIQRGKIKSLSGFWFRCQLKPISKKDLWLLKYETVFSPQVSTKKDFRSANVAESEYI